MRTQERNSWVAITLVPIALALLVMGCAKKINQNDGSADRVKTTEATEFRLNAQQIFSIVEHVQSDPRIDHEKAEAFLQSVLDGKVPKPSGTCLGRLCRTNRDCVSADCPDGFCAGGNAGGRLCIPL